MNQPITPIDDSPADVPASDQFPVILPADDGGSSAAVDAAVRLPAAVPQDAPSSAEGEETTPPETQLPETDVARTRADQDASIREELRRRLAQATRLPQGLRQRLGTLIDAAQALPDGSEAPLLKFGDAVRLFEEALPAHLLATSAESTELAHPAGESFFRDPAGELSDADARSIASAQLARTGFARRP